MVIPFLTIVTVLCSKFEYRYLVLLDVLNTLPCKFFFSFLTLFLLLVRDNGDTNPSAPL